MIADVTGYLLYMFHVNGYIIKWLPFVYSSYEL